MPGGKTQSAKKFREDHPYADWKHLQLTRFLKKRQPSPAEPNLSAANAITALEKLDTFPILQTIDDPDVGLIQRLPEELRRLVYRFAFLQVQPTRRYC